MICPRCASETFGNTASHEIQRQSRHYHRGEQRNRRRVRAIVAGAGAKIVFCARGEQEGHVLLRNLEKESGQVSFIPCDVRNLTDLKHVVDETLKGYLWPARLFDQ